MCVCEMGCDGAMWRAESGERRRAGLKNMDEDEDEG